LKNIGPISGIASSSDNTLFIFHRANRSFQLSSYSLQKYHFLYNCFSLFSFSGFPNDIEKIKREGPIVQDTVFIISEKNGTILGSWGANRYHQKVNFT